MPAHRFPYDLSSKDALIELVRRDRPQDNVQNGLVVFGDMFFSPTETEPGRTYIEMTNLYTGKKGWFVYRRLDIDIVLREDIPDAEEYVIVTVQGEITATKILAEINRAFALNLDYTDVATSDKPLTEATSYVYPLEILSDSYAYYGRVNIYVNATPEQLRARLTEDGAARLLEDGMLRLLN